MSPEIPVALITGGSAGLGKSTAAAFLRRGYKVVIVGRDEARLDEAKRSLEAGGGTGNVFAFASDVVNHEELKKLVDHVGEKLGRLDVLVNCVGVSDRGLCHDVDTERFDRLLHVNVQSALCCSRACLPLLKQSRGVIVNIGSLASKFGARYLGGYAIAKHALAGMTQQLRLELRSEGVHVALVSPGPIRRDDSGERYRVQVKDQLPESANAPGAGVRLHGLEPNYVATWIVRAAEKRLVDVMLPRRSRLLFILWAIHPRFGEWVLLKFTSSKSARA